MEGALAGIFRTIDRRDREADVSHYILVDWGTSNFRAYLTDGTGRVIERRQDAEGIMAVADRNFEAVARRQIGSWLNDHDVESVQMSGMIGSRQGWVEAPYVECPASPDEAARRMVQAGSRGNFWIAPGVSRRSKSGHFDVMRGEETQIFGAIGLAEREGNSGDGLYCLPGTHSKWAEVRKGSIVDFSTYMTGEVYAVLCAHSILGRLMPADGPLDEAGFDAGIERAFEDGGLLSHLFSARADVLLGAIKEGSARSYLSGILIGHELRDRRNSEAAKDGVRLIGDSRLAQLYRRGLERMGFASTMVDAETATIMGLIGLAERRMTKAAGMTALAMSASTSQPRSARCR
jgi:2-dehydro-3-deoxygalactonokinase